MRRQATRRDVLAVTGDCSPGASGSSQAATSGELQDVLEDVGVLRPYLTPNPMVRNSARRRACRPSFPVVRRDEVASSRRYEPDLPPYRATVVGPVEAEPAPEATPDVDDTELIRPICEDQERSHQVVSFRPDSLAAYHQTVEACAAMGERHRPRCWCPCGCTSEPRKGNLGRCAACNAPIGKGCCQHHDGDRILCCEHILRRLARQGSAGSPTFSEPELCVDGGTDCAQVQFGLDSAEADMELAEDAWRAEHPSAKGHNYGCEYCGWWNPRAPFPFPSCNICGASPSYHHGR